MRSAGGTWSCRCGAQLWLGSRGGPSPAGCQGSAGRALTLSQELEHGHRGRSKRSAAEGLPLLSAPPVRLGLQKLKHTESDKLQVQIQAYLDNVFDVGALLEDAETKNAALERVEELEENISHVSTTLCPFVSEAVQSSRCAWALLLPVPGGGSPGVGGLCGGTSRCGSEGIREVSGR